ncbi:hypothetical protein DYBT9275_06096 [Dyadobacter sp. CECT 9275]|uniref:DUF3300 domain-containing protein n=1 Tax=Dyadobacter helix TaxID=2822344 RepID=A0A916N8X0_9BACT|nr:hypothetical protein [Dyadobacter sp. CECT 9275]CAG5018907.1 hypothetical protein DYBT9275_06096 [Dyadobacter sp. CECT 9275]
MKPTVFLIAVLLSVVLPYKIFAQQEQEKLDLPGDNLNLYAALKLFQESETLEGFEKALNDESSQINNLDLNGDDNIDYIEVSDHIEEDIHYISLKVAVSENESQDVAVFIVRKMGDGQVEIQLVGDEELYGPDYIIEPNSETANDPGQTPNPGYKPSYRQAVPQPDVIYQVAAWPVVRFIFMPTYVVWRSPWRWNYYPPYWHPWRPSFWHYYYGYHYNLNPYYFHRYRRTVVYRYPPWRQHYYGGGIRSRSVIVVTRKQRGDYRNTYSKPSSARAGYNVSREKHPNTSGAYRRPSFDQNGRPVTNGPSYSRPGTTRPATSGPRPGNSTSPSRPGTSRPGNTNSPPSRPATRPGSGNTSRPAARPSESRPAARPGSNSRESTPRPANGNSTPRERAPR